jgi:RimJ/RimL family protein N-acetyltransferase
VGASELEDHVRLPNQWLLHIRPLRHCEDRPVRELYSRLSPRTRYLRFFSPMPVIPESLIALIACTDNQQRLALLAELDWNGRREVVALGNYGATADGAAEVGLVVRDEWQRQGIGTVLAARLMQAAEARGFDRFVAHALWENSAVIRKLLNRVADIVSATMRQGLSEMFFVRRRSQ